MTRPPAHLQARAKMDLLKDTTGHKVMPIVIHGDAAFAGQGVVYETMQMAQLDAYQTGGTINVICNNQVGFTATPSQGRSTRYASDLGKAFGCPIFHVNADDVEAVTRVFELAAEYRQQFHRDVVIDLIGSAPLSLSLFSSRSSTLSSSNSSSLSLPACEKSLRSTPLPFLLSRVVCGRTPSLLTLYFLFVCLNFFPSATLPRARTGTASTDTTRWTSPCSPSRSCTSRSPSTRAPCPSTASASWLRAPSPPRRCVSA